MQSHCANITFLKKVDTTGLFNKSDIKERNAQYLSVSVGNSYSEDKLTHTFLDNFHQGGKYYSQIASHQAELRREEKITDKKSLNI